MTDSEQTAQPAAGSILHRRSSWQIQLNVWHALFMREVLARLFANPYAWFWLFLEPVMFVLIMVSIRTFLGRMSGSIAGADVVPWMVLGLISFFMFRDGMMRGMAAIGANKALFAYRQIKTVDVVSVRCFVEGFIHTTVLFIFLIGLSFLGYNMLPHNALMVLFTWISLWLLGLATALLFSVLVSVVDEVRKIINMLTLPMMILSGAFLPIQYMPYELQYYLLLNPIAHGLETLRLFYFQGYWTLPGVDLWYLYTWLIGFMFAGLALHLRFASKMKAS